MSLHLTFRNLPSTDALKQHVEKKVEKFEKYVTYPMEVQAILSLEKTEHRAEITCHAEHRQLVAEGRSKDLYESIDQAVHKIEAQLKKEREKKKGHKSAHLASRPNSLKLAKDVDADLPHREKKITE
jgi:putative sigma-54 modulation protein